jgi:hypothetical protein
VTVQSIHYSSGAPVLDAPPRAAERDAARVRAVSNALDRYMIDPILGLVAPGLGDVVSAVFGLYVVGLSIRRGRPPVVIARMLLNLAGDALLGAVPVVGDLFDFGFKAHRANAQLFLAERGRRYRTTWRDWTVVVGAGLVLLTALAITVLALGSALRWLFGLI